MCVSDGCEKKVPALYQRPRAYVHDVCVRERAIPTGLVCDDSSSSISVRTVIISTGKRQEEALAAAGPVFTRDGAPTVASRARATDKIIDSTTVSFRRPAKTRRIQLNIVAKTNVRFSSRGRTVRKK